VFILVGSIGRLKKTIFPAILSTPNFFNSTKDLTYITSARIPLLGVATDPPSAQIETLIELPVELSILAYSKFPLTHLGTMTG
jgi:hypothetical protein